MSRGDDRGQQHSKDANKKGQPPGSPLLAGIASEVENCGRYQELGKKKGAKQEQCCGHTFGSDFGGSVASKRSFKDREVARDRRLGRQRKGDDKTGGMSPAAFGFRLMPPGGTGFTASESAKCPHLVTHAGDDHRLRHGPVTCPSKPWSPPQK